MVRELEDICWQYGLERLALVFEAEELQDKSIAHNWQMPADAMASYIFGLQKTELAENVLIPLERLPIEPPAVPGQSKLWALTQSNISDFVFYIFAEASDGEHFETLCEKERSMAFVSACKLAAESCLSNRTTTNYAAHLNILIRFGTLLSTTLDIDQLYWKIYNLVLKVMPADSFFIGLTLPDGQHLDVQFMVDEGKRYPRTIEPIGKGAGSQAVLNNVPVLLNRSPQRVKFLEKNRNAVNAFGNTARISRSILACPIVSQGRTIGVITTQSYQYLAYNEDHLQLLQALTAQAGVAIVNARLYSRELKKSKVLEIIDTINQKAWKQGEPVQVIRELLQLLQNHFGQNSHTFLYRDGVRKKWQAYYYAGAHAEQDGDARAEEIKRKRLPKIPRLTKPLIVSNSAGDTWLDKLFTHAARSYIAIPMMVDMRLAGILVAGNEAAMAFDDDDAKWYEIILSRFGLVFQRLYFMRELSQERDRLLAMLDHLDEGVQILDENLNIVFANRWARLHAMQKNGTSVCHKVLFRSDEICTGCPLSPANPLRRNATFELAAVDGRVLQISLSKFNNSDGKTYTLEIIQDITQKREAFNKKMRMQTMEVALAMAGSIAHELSQPLMGITGLSELILEELPEDDVNFAQLQEIEIQASRLRELIQKFQNITLFQKMDYPGKEILDVDRSIRYGKN